MPPNRCWPSGRRAQTITIVEEHGDARLSGGKRLGELVPRRDEHRLADGVQRNFVTCTQYLDAADTGDHVVLEVEHGRRLDRLQDAQRAVVERRIAPYEKCACPIVRQVLADGVSSELRAFSMPGGNPGLI